MYDSCALASLGSGYKVVVVLPVYSDVTTKSQQQGTGKATT